MNRREFFKEGAVAAATAAFFASRPEWTRNAEAGDGLPPFEQGKYQTFPRIKLNGFLCTQDIDLGTLGPDVDTVVGMDFLGNIPTSAQIVSMPADGNVRETRVVFIKRTDLNYVQINGAISGDRFDMHKIKEWGIDDAALDAIGLRHARETAHKHQKVVYLHDLGLMEKLYAQNERALLTRIIRAQVPALPAIGIPESNFTFPRS